MKRNWNTEELIEYFSISKQEKKLLKNKRGNHNKLGFIVLFKYFKKEARFPIFKREIPKIIINFIAKQINVDYLMMNKYEWKSRSIKRHKTEILDYLGFRLSTVVDAKILRNWIVNNVECINKNTVEEVFFNKCRELKIVPPSVSRVVLIELFFPQ